MYAIQIGAKFAKIEYVFGAKSSVWNVIASVNPKVFTSAQAADTELQRVKAWLDQRIEWVTAQSALCADNAIKLDQKLAELHAKQETLVVQPFNKVEKMVSMVRRDILQTEGDIRCAARDAREFRNLLQRYTYLKTTGFVVVKLEKKIAA